MQADVFHFVMSENTKKLINYFNHHNSALVQNCENEQLNLKLHVVYTVTQKHRTILLATY